MHQDTDMSSSLNMTTHPKVGFSSVHKSITWEQRDLEMEMS